MPAVPAVGGWRLRARVPDGIFTLAVDADDATAAAEHAAFADRCLPLLAAASGPEHAARLRAEVVSQLAALRLAVAASGLGYLGALSGEHQGRPALVLLGVAAMPMAFPAAIDPVSLLAAMLRHQYPGAAVEEFATADGSGVGIRRCEQISLSPSAPGGALLTADGGISQALVPFPDAGLVGAVTGFCFTPEDIDLATVFTATIAYHLAVTSDSRDGTPQA